MPAAALWMRPGISRCFLPYANFELVRVGTTPLVNRVAPEQRIVRPDTRLTLDYAKGLSEEDLFWALMEPAWDDPGLGTKGQRILACVTYFIRDVDNGGIEQAIWNRESSAVQEVIQALEALGARESAELVRKAEQVLLGRRPPEDLEVRRERLDQLERAWLDEHIEPLNRQLYGEERLYRHFHAYVEQHPEEFFRPS
jgi:hypothetical protein